MWAHPRLQCSTSSGGPPASPPSPRGILSAPLTGNRVHPPAPLLCTSLSSCFSPSQTKVKTLPARLLSALHCPAPELCLPPALLPCLCCAGVLQNSAGCYHAGNGWDAGSGCCKHPTAAPAPCSSPEPSFRGLFPSPCSAPAAPVPAPHPSTLQDCPFFQHSPLSLLGQIPLLPAALRSFELPLLLPGSLRWQRGARHRACHIK